MKNIRMLFPLLAVVCLMFPGSLFAGQESEVFSLENTGPEQRLRVIVELEGDFIHQGSHSSEDLFRQRSLISESQDAFLDLISEYEAQNITRYSTVPFLAMDIYLHDLESLSSIPGVKSVKLDQVLEPGMHEALPITGASEAHARGFTGKGWAVAVLDTGVDSSHLFLEGKVREDLEVCILYDSGCPNGHDAQAGPGAARDFHGHGTHVAGIAAGRELGLTSGERISGVAPEAEVIAMRIIDERNWTWISETAAALELVLQIHERGLSRVAAVNLSMGSLRYYRDHCDDEYPLLATMVNNLRSKKIPVTVSAGNERQGLPSGRVISGDPARGLPAPACLRSAVAVGATTKKGHITEYSNHNHMVDLLAPGSSILSADRSSPRSLRYLSGTSMAAPQAAGAFALLKSARPSAAVGEMIEVLQTTGKVIRKDAADELLHPVPELRAGLAVNMMRAIQKREAECIFDHLEREYPSYLDPARPPTHDSSGLIYRYYPESRAYLAVYSGPEDGFFDQLLYLGPLTDNDIVPLLPVGEASEMFGCSQDVATE